MKCSVTKGSINYEIYGDGFPILILHSMGTDHRSMSCWIEPIFETIQGFQRIYIDLPAHGKSLIEESFSSSNDMLISILDFVDKTIPNQLFSLIGFSYGGYLAQGILHHRKTSIKSICLLATSLHLIDRSLPEKVVYKRDEKLLSLLDPDIKASIETLMTYQDKEHIEYFLREIQPGRMIANKKFLTSDWREKGYFLSEEPLQDMRGIPQPALFLMGRQDSICGYVDHISLINKFSNASIAILDQAGHMLQIEKREIVQSLVRDWLIRSTINT